MGKKLPSCIYRWGDGEKPDCKFYERCPCDPACWSCKNDNGDKCTVFNHVRSERIATAALVYLAGKLSTKDKLSTTWITEALAVGEKTIDELDREQGEKKS